MGESAGTNEGRLRELGTRLADRYPDLTVTLDHTSALELLVATILSAQCTDARVNEVTPALFQRFPTAEDYASADREELEEYVRSTGFYRNKAKHIQQMAARLVADHGGEIPYTMEDLVKLPGVARKTANVILNTAFGEPTIAVDTHIFRVANRTGLAKGKTPLEVEKRLTRLTPEEFRKDAHHWLILHGRYVCKARKPECPDCIIADLCEYRRKTPAGDAA